jgi:hypothetical protein
LISDETNVDERLCYWWVPQVSRGGHAPEMLLHHQLVSRSSGFKNLRQESPKTGPL